MAQEGKVRKQPERSCVACRTVRAKRDLVRIVRRPDGSVVVDTGNGKLPGRGAYLCRDAACLERAVRAKALERALKQPVPREVIETLSALLGAATAPSERGDQ